MMNKESLFHLLEKLSEQNLQFSEYKENESLRLVSEELDITLLQALFFVTTFKVSVESGYKVSVNSLSEELGVKNILIFKHFKEITELERKKLLSVEKDYDSSKFYLQVPTSTFNSLLEGATGEELEMRPRTFIDFCDAVYHNFNGVCGNRQESVKRRKIIEDLIVQCEFLPEIKWLHKQMLDSEHIAVLAYLVYRKVTSDDDSVESQHILERLYYSAQDIYNERRRIVRGHHPLLRKKMCEVKDDVFFDGTYLGLTPFAMDSLLKGISDKDKETKYVPRSLKEIELTGMSKKPMFFGEELNTELDNIEELLSAKKFTEFQNRAKELGLNSGLTVLFHGAPGTGKTEMVKQLALKTGRRLFIVDISGIRDKYVGESEKKLNKIFYEYDKIASHSRKKPILLFNEADAIIGSRINVSSSVDQMNNSMQNILLQKLEDFDGVLFATTNFFTNIDKAFDRRFLFKVRFDIPKGSRYNELVSRKLKDVTKEMKGFIAENYYLSGGQLDNISRKIEVQRLMGKRIDKNFMKTILESEVNSRRTTQQLGFKKPLQN